MLLLRRVVLESLILCAFLYFLENHSLHFVPMVHSWEKQKVLLLRRTAARRVKSADVQPWKGSSHICNQLVANVRHLAS